MLLGGKEAKDFIPKKLLKVNKHGAYINGIWMIVILSGGIIALQAVMPDAQAVMAQLVKLNSIVMPMRYLWVFIAYLALRKQHEKFHKGFDNYQMTKHQWLAYIAGLWGLAVTIACCLMGMYSSDPFTLCLNIATPVVLLLLGLIMPTIRRRQEEK